MSNSPLNDKYVIKVNLHNEHCTPTSTESAKKGRRYFVISSMLKLNYIANLRPGEQDGHYTNLFSYLLINIAVRVFWLKFLCYHFFVADFGINKYNIGSYIYLSTTPNNKDLWVTLLAGGQKLTFELRLLSHSESRRLHGWNIADTA